MSDYAPVFHLTEEIAALGIEIGELLGELSVSPAFSVYFDMVFDPISAASCPNTQLQELARAPLKSIVPCTAGHVILLPPIS